MVQVRLCLVDGDGPAVDANQDSAALRTRRRRPRPTGDGERERSGGYAEQAPVHDREAQKTVATLDEPGVCTDTLQRSAIALIRIRLPSAVFTVKAIAVGGTKCPTRFPSHRLVAFVNRPTVAFANALPPLTAPFTDFFGRQQGAYDLLRKLIDGHVNLALYGSRLRSGTGAPRHERPVGSVVHVR